MLYMSNIFVFDCETTGALRNKGHPFDPRNKLCTLAWLIPPDESSWCWDIEYTPTPYGQSIYWLKEKIMSSDLIVGFNLKFDIHWGRRYGLDFGGRKWWDCQIAHFILTNQTHPYPSLDEVAAYYGLPAKLDEVRVNYWDQGIDTDAVPWPILKEYAKQDVTLTYQIYLRQIVQAKESGKLALIELAMEDCITFEEMEFNGFKYDFELSKKKAMECLERISTYQKGLNALGPYKELTWTTEQISAVLYGGVVKLPYQEAYLFVYKNPKKEPVWKLRWTKRELVFPRLVEPLKGSEMKKEGIFATDEKTLKSIKATGFARQIIENILFIREQEKLHDTYYAGLVEKAKEYGWDDSYIHGQLNQCVARTGRSASSNPNLQNIAGDVKECFVTRY
jgi:DNA polymerase I-like protein with 3'-5' exonuclease and polymerase domains